MPSTLTITLFAYAVMIGLFGAALWAIIVAGGIGVAWQAAATLAPYVERDETPAAVVDEDQPYLDEVEDADE